MADEPEPRNERDGVTVRIERRGAVERGDQLEEQRIPFRIAGDRVQVDGERKVDMGEDILVLRDRRRRGEEAVIAAEQLGV